ncbi:hypothetical protein OZX68_05465 [Streptococcaceae bacterium ESL0729]|nr:hypothetical protein OZX68_05465 [Streptococcaceae bacterium ESL0729]
MTNYYNYLNLTKGKNSQTFPQGFNMDKGSYFDPDSASKELYEDLADAIFKNNGILPSGNLIEIDRVGKAKKADYYEIQATIFSPTKEKLYTVYLGSDYIGPSRFWANPKIFGNQSSKLQSPNLSDLEIIDFLKTTRTLGGHMLFPRSIELPDRGWISDITLNYSRGGDRKVGKRSGLFDRFDLTLLDLKNWYSDSGQRVHLFNTFYLYQLWFNEFVDFKHFAKFFALEDFLSEDLESIKDITSFNGSEFEYFSPTAQVDQSNRTIPTSRDGYLQYAKGSSHIIEKRTKRLLD